MSLFDGNFSQQDADNNEARRLQEDRPVVFVLMMNDAVMGAVDSEEKKVAFEDKVRAKQVDKAYNHYGRFNHAGVECYMQRFIFHWVDSVPFNDIEG